LLHAPAPAPALNVCLPPRLHRAWPLLPLPRSTQLLAPHNHNSLPADNDDEVALSAGGMGKAEAVDRLRELLGEGPLAALQDAAWKARLEAMEALLERASEPELLAGSGCVLVQAIQHVPGWDEKNFQVRRAPLPAAAGCCVGRLGWGG
jgi:hypothetical protein